MGVKEVQQISASIDKRNKDLQQFLKERGDNITAQDLTEAHAIRDDIAKLKTDLEQERSHVKSVEQLRADADAFNRYVNEPATGMRHQGKPGERASVLGSQYAGDAEVLPKEEAQRRNEVNRLLRQSGRGLFGKRKFEAISDPNYAAAFRGYFRKGERSKNFRLLEDGLDNQGGYLAPVETIMRLIQRKPSPTNILGFFDQINSTRDAVSIPKVNYSGTTDDTLGEVYSTGFRATMTDEIPTSDTQALVSDTSVFGTARVPVYTWLIEGVLTNNQVEDAMFDPLAWLNGKFAETVDLLKVNMAINGNGATQPAGLLSNPNTPTNTGDPSQPMIVYTGNTASPYLTPDSILGVSEDVPEQYDENARFLYKKTTTGKTIRQFKDSQGRYLFGEGFQDNGLAVGRKTSLNGYPISWSQFMPDPANNAYPLLFGDFSGATMVNRIGFSIQLLREVAARRNQIIVLGRVRFGFQCLEGWRLRALQVHA